MIYYYNLETAIFEVGNKTVFLDKYRYQMCAPARAGGSDILVPAAELGRIYSPGMTVSFAGESVSFTMNGKTAVLTAGSDEMKVGWSKIKMLTACEISEGVLYIPAAQVMHMAFGKHICTTNDLNTPYSSLEERGMDRYDVWPLKNMMIAISDDPNYRIDNYALHYIEVANRGKTYGEQFKAYWMESAKKIIPYTAYIPTKYTPEKPSRIVIFLHGGSIYVGDKYAFKMGGTKLQRACEKYNYILLCANSVGLLSGFGSRMTISDNAEASYYQMGDDSLMQAVDEIKKVYNIDVEHMYLMGNSMGGGATFTVANAHPGMFRAIACGGAAPRIVPGNENAGLEAFTRIPSVILAGTEDEFGFDNLLKSHKALVAAGADNEIVPVAGGLHLSAWSEVLDEAFDFYERHS